MASWLGYLGCMWDMLTGRDQAEWAEARAREEHEEYMRSAEAIERRRKAQAANWASQFRERNRKGLLEQLAHLEDEPKELFGDFWAARQEILQCQTGAIPEEEWMAYHRFLLPWALPEKYAPLREVRGEGGEMLGFPDGQITKNGALRWEFVREFWPKDFHEFIGPSRMEGPADYFPGDVLTMMALQMAAVCAFLKTDEEREEMLARIWRPIATKYGQFAEKEVEELVEWLRIPPYYGDAPILYELSYPYLLSGFVPNIGYVYLAAAAAEKIFGDTNIPWSGCDHITSYAFVGKCIARIPMKQLRATGDFARAAQKAGERHLECWLHIKPPPRIYLSRREIEKEIAPWEEDMWRNMKEKRNK